MVAYQVSLFFTYSNVFISKVAHGNNGHFNKIVIILMTINGHYYKAKWDPV